MSTDTKCNYIVEIERNEVRVLTSPKGLARLKWLGRSDKVDTNPREEDEEKQSTKIKKVDGQWVQTPPLGLGTESL